MRKRYKDPAKPTPTHREPMSDRGELIWIVVLSAIAAVFTLIEVIPWD